jgi:DNA primase
MESCSIRDAAVKLHDWFLTTKGNPVPKKGSDPTPAPISKMDDEGENKPLTFALQGIDHAHAYLQQRGITEEVAKQFGIGFFPGKGSMNGRVVFPIHNEGGELIAYAGRAIDETEPKYKLPAGFKKSAVLFNLHRVNDDYVIIVEGFFDCMKVHCAGYSGVVIALMGSSLSMQQQELLKRFREIVVFLDGDDAGRQAAKEIAARLAPSQWVRVISLADGLQPDHLSSAELQQLLEPVFE